MKIRKHLLKESEERLRLALATTHQGLFDLNVPSGSVTVNREYATMLGYAYESFHETAESWRARLHPNDRELVSKVYRDYAAGLRPDYRVEFRLRTSDGSWIWIYSVGAIVAYDIEGKPLRILGTHLNITERKEAELRQQESDQRLSFALDSAGIGDWNMDLRTNIATRSLQHDRCFGYTEAVAEWGYDTFLAHVHELDRERVNSAYMAAMAGQGDHDVEFRTVWPDSSIHWLLSKGKFYFDDNGTAYRVAGILIDVSKRKSAEASMLAIETRYSMLFENSMDGVLQSTTDGVVVAANSAACAMFRLSESEICQKSRSGLVDMKDARLPLLLAERELHGHAKSELWMIRGDGSRFEAEISSSLYNDHSGSRYASLVIRDITDRKKAEADINQLAFFDPLTGLPNRRLLMDRLGQTLSSAQRTGQISVLIFIDLDHFKYINDARGHAVGDEVLKCIAHRLTPLLRQEDTLSRIGGDEFVVLMASPSHDLDRATHAALAVAEKIRLALSEPATIEGQKFNVSGSIGVTLLPKYGQTADDLLREADTAMYRAKNAGRNRIAFFELTMQKKIEERLAIEHDLALAIAAGQMEMVLQPQVDVYGNAVGGELLMRWTHPVRGPVSPAIFIPIAEESGIILQLGNWTLHQGCQALVRLAAAGRQMDLSINVSPHQFRQADFIEQVRAALAQAGADPTHLILEITEGLLIENIEDTIDRMLELARLGIRFSIDDFGTGYSSLSYLKRLPLFELKIDKSFIQDMPRDPDDTAIVQSILSMAKHLRLRVVAEGVETRQQADFLMAAGCDAMQGYLYARPMPIDKWMQTEMTLTGEGGAR
ncbi:sensor domain-containing protein [Actimicrobium antarcticum]|uniref:GGDEF domain-containing protein n=1 Tax=Actimicrobium antarcticum TaxID=1051899 RepID=A0ABP7TIH7_9BURK